MWGGGWSVGSPLYSLVPSKDFQALSISVSTPYMSFSLCQFLSVSVAQSIRLFTSVFSYCPFLHLGHVSAFPFPSAFIPLIFVSLSLSLSLSCTHTHTHTHTHTCTCSLPKLVTWVSPGEGRETQKESWKDDSIGH